MKPKPPLKAVMKPPGGAPIGTLMPETPTEALVSTAFWISKAKLTPLPFMNGREKSPPPPSFFSSAEYSASRSLILSNLMPSISCRWRWKPSTFEPSPTLDGILIVSDCGLPFRVKIPAMLTVTSIDPVPSSFRTIGVSTPPTGENPASDCMYLELWPS